MNNFFDTIVIGAGAFGSAVAYYCQRAGLKTAVIDTHNPPHHFGGSRGQTRLYRAAYAEDPRYVPLALKAGELWTELEALAQRPLFFQSGGLEAGLSSSELISGTIRSANAHALGLQFIDHKDVAKRFPAFRIPKNYQTVFDPSAGVLLTGPIISSYLTLAIGLGAVKLSNTRAKEIRQTDRDQTWEVILQDETKLTGKNLICCAGGWTPELFPEFTAQLSILSKPVFYYKTDAADVQFENGCPSFCIEDESGEMIYGFPQSRYFDFKIARHTGGKPCSSVERIDESSESEDQDLIQNFSDRFISSYIGLSTGSDVCFYDLSPDRHFLFGNHPKKDRLWIVTGTSGHGFKFSSALGWAISKLVRGESINLDLEFLDLDRFIPSNKVAL